MESSLDLIVPELPESRKGLRKVGDYKNFKAPTAKEESLVVPELPELHKGLRKVKDYLAFKQPGPVPAPPGGDPAAAAPDSKAPVT